MAPRLDRDFGELLPGQAEVMHVALGAHGIERGHGEADIDLPILGLAGQHAAAEHGELVDAQHQHAVIAACRDGVPGLAKGCGAAGAGVFAIHHGYARHAQWPQGALARKAPAIGRAAIDRLDLLALKARIVDGALDRGPAEILKHEFGITPDAPHGGADDGYLAHQRASCRGLKRWERTCVPSALARSGPTTSSTGMSRGGELARSASRGAQMRTPSSRST